MGRGRILWVALGTAMLCSSGCSKPDAPPPVPVKTFTGLGVTFTMPEAYKAETATDNAFAHQVAVDSSKEPGVLTLRFDSTKPSAPLDLGALAEEAKTGRGDAHDALVSPSTLKIGSKNVEARALKFTILGLPFTDVIAVTPVGDRNYVVFTHAADEDLPKATKMFDTVLGSVHPSP